MNQNAPCKLCGKSAKLLKKSHVIPDFMYKGIPDELNRMIVAELNSSNTKPKFQQSGYYDKYILCSKCDNELIGKLERYVAMLLFGGKSLKVPIFDNAISPDGVKSIIIEDIDYRLFKLCILSILWRAHISNINFFKKINIGENAKQIKKMLLTGDPKSENDFKITIIAIRNLEGLLRMVVDPAVVKIGNGEIAIFFINGLFYFIDLFPNSDFVLFQKHFIKEYGTNEIVLLDGQIAKNFMYSFGLPRHVVDNYFLNE